MTTFYQFASDSPWLTFFLFVLVIGLINKLLSFIAVLVRGHKPPSIKVCKCKDRG